MAGKKRLKKDGTNASSETIGSRLAQARANRGFTQSGVSRMVGVPQNMISEFERDCRRVNVEVLAKLAMALNVSADELLGIKPLLDKRAVPPRLRILRRVEKIYELPRATQDLVLRSLELMIEGGFGRIPAREKGRAVQAQKKKA